jgi:16S rRNA (cytidine1402-2'-O)-methyltransferase
MHLNSPTHNVEHSDQTGILYVVSTPIGNRDDITLRALKILKEADLIAAEDTRTTGRFLKGHGITGQFVSYHEHNENQRTPILLKKLHSGVSIALVTNAGTPAVSDPGYRLITKAVESGVRVVPVPGASAATAALSVAGLPTDAFVFVGFLARKRAKRLNQLKELANDPRTLIFYESPRRVPKLTQDILSVMGDRHSVLAREMTKRHEEFLRGRLSALYRIFQMRGQIKGECTLLVSGCTPKPAQCLDGLKEELQSRLQKDDKSLSEIAKDYSRKFSLPKKTVYQQALRIKNQIAGSNGQNDDQNDPNR